MDSGAAIVNGVELGPETGGASIVAMGVGVVAAGAYELAVAFNLIPNFIPRDSISDGKTFRLGYSHCCRRHFIFTEIRSTLCGTAKEGEREDVVPKKTAVMFSMGIWLDVIGPYDIDRIIQQFVVGDFHTLVRGHAYGAACH